MRATCCGKSPLDDAGSGLNEPLYREFQRYRKNIVTSIAITATTTSTAITQNGTTCGNEAWTWAPVGRKLGSEVGSVVEDDDDTSSLNKRRVRFNINFEIVFFIEHQSESSSRKYNKLDTAAVIFKF